MPNWGNDIDTKFSPLVPSKVGIAQSPLMVATATLPVNNSAPFFWFLGQISLSTIRIMISSAFLLASLSNVAVLTSASHTSPPNWVNRVYHTYMGSPFMEVPDKGILPLSAFTFSKYSKNASSPSGTMTVPSSSKRPIFSNSSVLKCISSRWVSMGMQ